MFSNVTHDLPPTTGKKMLGFPCSHHFIQPRKNPDSHWGGITPTRWINSNSRNPKTKKSPAKSLPRTSSRTRIPWPTEIPRKHSTERVPLPTIQLKESITKIPTWAKRNWKRWWFSTKTTEEHHQGNPSRVQWETAKKECQSNLGRVWKIYCTTMWEWVREVPVYDVIYQAK